MDSEQISSIKITDYNYALPDSAIAKYPLEERDSSKLLHWNRGEIEDHHFRDLPSLLPNNSLLVFNNSRVIRARLKFNKSTGAKIEIFCLEPYAPADYERSFAQTQRCSWIATIGNAKKWKEDNLMLALSINGLEVTLTAKKINTDTNNTIQGARVVEFSWDNDTITFSEILEASGNIPIPPYLKRESDSNDSECYQTIYSKVKGSVAAPTAGLHFTESVLEKLKERDIKRAEVTLHVGAGTFMPVKSDEIGGHTMHTEHISASQEFLETLIESIDSVVAVGTTSIRTIESLYWMGVKLLSEEGLSIDALTIDQWFPYNYSGKEYSAKEALSRLLLEIKENNITTLYSSTQILIAPGYNYRVIRGMVTNFHQPQSTLLLLISAFFGDEWKRIYTHAIDNNYRFLSYGDSNLYLK